MAFDQAIADRICELICEGTPLKPICRMDGMPSWRTVYNWINDVPEFAAAMEEARKLGARAIAEEALEIADTPMEGVEITTDEKGVSEKRGDMLGHRKLRIETRLKLLAKWHPREYGDKLAIGGADDLPALRTMSDDQLEARIAALQAKINGGKG